MVEPTNTGSHHTGSAGAMPPALQMFCQNQKRGEPQFSTLILSYLSVKCKGFPYWAFRMDSISYIPFSLPTMNLAADTAPSASMAREPLSCFRTRV